MPRATLASGFATLFLSSGRTPRQLSSYPDKQFLEGRQGHCLILFLYLPIFKNNEQFAASSRCERWEGFCFSRSKKQGPLRFRADDALTSPLPDRRGPRRGPRAAPKPAAALCSAVTRRAGNPHTFWDQLFVQGEVGPFSGKWCLETTASRCPRVLSGRALLGTHLCLS